MQRQRELHDEDPNVVHDGEQQLAQSLGPRIPAGGRGVLGLDRSQLVEPQESFEESHRGVAEMRPRGVEPDYLTLDEKTGEARGDAVRIEVEPREHLGHLDPFRQLLGTYLVAGARVRDAGHLAHQPHRLRRRAARKVALTANAGLAARLHGTIRSLIVAIIADRCLRRIGPGRRWQCPANSLDSL